MDIFRSDVFFRNVMVCLVRDRSIFIGIRDREICNGTTGYFGPLVILRLGSKGPGLISVWDFNRAKDYFKLLRHGVIDYF